MNKLFIRLFVAFAAFSFGLVLTNFLKPKVTFDSSNVVTVRLQPRVKFLALSEDEAQIREIYRQYGPAQTRHDRKFFERVETEDFTLIDGDEKMSRAGAIKWMEDQPTNIVYEIRVDQLTFFDHMAQAHGSLEIRCPDGSVEEWPFVDVWVKRDGTWRIRSTTSQ